MLVRAASADICASPRPGSGSDQGEPRLADGEVRRSPDAAAVDPI
jgi:hypothetical protein